MSEVKHKAQAVQIEYVCDNCQVGTMQMVPREPHSWTSSAIFPSAFPMPYRHRCNHCGKEQDFPKCYPTVRYERAEAEPAPPKGPRFVVERCAFGPWEIRDTTRPFGSLPAVTIGTYDLSPADRERILCSVADLLNREAGT